MTGDTLADRIARFRELREKAGSIAGTWRSDYHCANITQSRFIHAAANDALPLLEDCHKRITELETQLASVMPFDKIGADRLADEVAVLIRLHKLDSRSPAGDALLDYREPPQTERSERLVAMESRIEELERDLSFREKASEGHCLQAQEDDARIVELKAQLESAEALLTHILRQQANARPISARDQQMQLLAWITDYFAKKKAQP